ncbi:MAG: type II 3-dehydroquinate dehydratase [Alkaliphilus sp.]
MRNKIVVIHGPNLNLLGTRETEIYGKNSLAELNAILFSEAIVKEIELEIFQSNSEGEIIDLLHKYNDITGIVINPAAYTHYSIAIMDAIKAISTPVVEVHLSNIHDRELFRSNSVTAKACIGQISGFGYYSYLLALDVLVK